MASGQGSKALARWLLRERAATRLATLLLLAMALPAGLAAVSVGSMARIAAAVTAVAIGAGGCVWLARCAGELRRTLDTLVNEDRLDRKHAGVVDAYVVKWIKDGRRFGFERLPKMRFFLGAVMVACVALALVPRRDPEHPLPKDVVLSAGGVLPGAAAGSADKLLASADLVAQGDDALRMKRGAVARERFEKAYALRQPLHQLTPADGFLTAALLVIETRLARVACLEGDAKTAAKHIEHIESALPLLQESAAARKILQEFERWLLDAKTQQQQGRCLAGST